MEIFKEGSEEELKAAWYLGKLVQFSYFKNRKKFLSVVENYSRFLSAHITDEQKSQLSTDSNPKNRFYSPFVDRSSENLLKLSKDPDQNVRWAVAANSADSPSLLKVLKNDSIDAVSECAEFILAGE
jgi:hypothetical protein